MITWKKRVANLTRALGRKPTLNELLSMRPTGDSSFD